MIFSHLCTLCNYTFLSVTVLPLEMSSYEAKIFHLEHPIIHRSDKLDEIAKNNGKVRFNMLPPTMQNLTVQYLCDVLESESNLCKQSNNSVDALSMLNFLLEEKRILANLDGSTLEINTLKELKEYINFIEQCILDLEKSPGRETEEKINHKLDQFGDKLRRIYPLGNRADALALVLDHFGLNDYYRYIFLQKENEGKGLTRINSLILQAIKEKIK